MKLKRLYTFVLAIVVGVFFFDKAMAGTNQLIIQDIVMQSGGSAFISFQLENSDPITGFQCDLYLPEGFSIERYSYLLGRTTSNQHGVSTRRMDNGAIRIVCASSTNATFSGNSGEVLIFRINTSLKVGQYEMTLKNIILTDSDATRYTSEDVTSTIVVSDANKLELYDVNLPSGSTELSLPIFLQNESPISGFQCDLLIPEGLEIEKDENGNSIVEQKRSTENDHNVIVNQIKDGVIRIVCSSVKCATFSGNDGEVLNVLLKSSLTTGSYVVKLSNVILTNPDAARFTSSDVSCNIIVKELQSYTLTYLIDNVPYKIYTIIEGTAIAPEEEPIKEGYTFSGWSEILETMPGHDVTVTGSFTINTYKLTYMIGEKVYKVVEYEYGAAITPEPQPEGDYIRFEWVDLPETMPASDVTVYADFETGIDVATLNQSVIRIYSPEGMQLNELQKGVNIVMMYDGTVRRVFVK